MRKLIVNADDFGFTRDVDEGIVEAHRSGILTATTLMANGEAFDHAVALARETPSLDIGCHLVLVERWGAGDLAWALAQSEARIFERFAAQARKIVKAGVQPTHLDTHKHAHLLPAVLGAITRVAREFGIAWVRRPLGPPRGRKMRGVRSTDHFAGFRATGYLNRETLIAELEGLPEGLTEFMCHPGKLGEELRGAATRLKESRAIELAALTSPEVRDAIGRLGIQLVNYRA
ncbi:MAG TPA: ChbG/HpnK family deacetylase [Bryobacteraceae bacterium]|nr:ChbG/HpnK family deacetylase [Bryobacteraceae bacterium]